MPSLLSERWQIVPVEALKVTKRKSSDHLPGGRGLCVAEGQTDASLPDATPLMQLHPRFLIIYELYMSRGDFQPFSRKHGEGSSAKTLALLHKLDT